MARLAFVSPLLFQESQFVLCQAWFGACHQLRRRTWTRVCRTWSDDSWIWTNIPSKLINRRFESIYSYRYRSKDNPKNGFIVARWKEKRRSTCLSDDTESRAEISAPQFGDNRIPPLHTILEVTVRHNTWHHVSWPGRGSLLNRWPFIFLSHFLPIVVPSNEAGKKKRKKKKELLFPASLRSDKSHFSSLFPTF